MSLLDLMIPAVHAQAAANAASKTVAEEAPQGIAGLFSYLVTHLPLWLAGIVIVIVTFGIAQWLAATIRDKIVLSRGEEVSENALVLIEKVLRLLVLIIGVTIALAINGLNFTAVVGALSLGIGFAIKDILANFISSLVLLAQNNIRIGDLVEIGSVKGTIESIDTRVTVLRGIDGRQVMIPNQEMMNATIINYMANPYRRLELYTYISWDSDVDKGINLIRKVIDEDQDILKEPKPLVLLDNIEDSSNYAIRVLFWVETQKRRWLTIRSNLHFRILKAFEQAHIEVAYPVQSVTVSENVQDTLATFKKIRNGEETGPHPQPSNSEILEAAKATGKLESIPVLLGQEVLVPETVPATPGEPVVGQPGGSKPGTIPSSPAIMDDEIL